MRTDIEIGSGRTSAIVEGDATRGVVVLVPGYTGSKEDFLPLLKPLATAGFRAVAIDQRGQYRSSWGAGPDSYRLGALAGDVLAVAAWSGAAPVHLIGHSFGGLVCRQAVLTAPDRFASLVLMSSGPAAIGGARRATLQAALDAGSTQEAWEVLLPRHRSSSADPLYQQGHERFLQRRFESNDPVGLRVMAQEVFAATDRTDELARAGVPVLVLFGSRDDSWSPAQQRSMAVRLGARVVEVPGVGHAPATSDPQATMAGLMGFYDLIAPA